MGNLLSVHDGNDETTYAIDPDSRRIAATIDEIERRWIYDGALNPVAQFDATGALTAVFVYGSTSHSPDYVVVNPNDASEQIYRIVSDHLGSPRQLVDISDGSIDWEFEYSVFGEMTTTLFPADESEIPEFLPFGFAGGVYDDSTGLVRFGARDYSVELGRWTAKDPIRFRGGLTNLYSYVDADPVNSRDVDGRQAEGSGSNVIPGPWPEPRDDDEPDSPENECDEEPDDTPDPPVFGSMCFLTDVTETQCIYDCVVPNEGFCFNEKTGSCPESISFTKCEFFLRWGFSVPTEPVPEIPRFREYDSLPGWDFPPGFLR